MLIKYGFKLSPIPIFHPPYVVSTNTSPIDTVGVQKKAAENFKWGR